jgi:hypothetical protein
MTAALRIVNSPAKAQPLESASTWCEQVSLSKLRDDLVIELEAESFNSAKTQIVNGTRCDAIG